MALPLLSSCAILLLINANSSADWIRYGKNVLYGLEGIAKRETETTDKKRNEKKRLIIIQYKFV